MDDTLQKALRKATQNARQLLEHEFEEQLDGRFDIRPDGTIPDEPGPHLDAEERLLREKLVTAIEHREAGGTGAEEAVATFLREAAFTTLNRFVALKMLEERGVVKESISEGQQSSGFKEFTMLAPGLSELSDGGYRLYLESLFDEIGQEVKVLFDREVVAGRLWPRRPALEELLEILNGDALVDAWQETETIGWVYQYFNADSEREEMREESSTPRNSHELAVRNQFFTPHYVVQFLTDNTLGRTWHEMHKGDTRIREECDYFAERADEVFLDEGEAPPEPSNDSSNALINADEDGGSGLTTEASHEEDDEGPTYVPYRAKKDPRELRILDPACGSGHFLLYAFDLLWTIYEEAWEDSEAPAFEETGQPLSEDYESLDDLHSALPRLILEKNLYGVDIDPRATQIASFALWMRAQEAYSEVDLARDERPAITKTNMVAAEPMPGDEALRKGFVESLQPPALGQLVDVVFDKMGLANEAGTLLRIEEEIRDAIQEAKRQWEQPKQLELLPEEMRQEFRQAGLFDVSNISDEEFWSNLEEQIYRALEEYAEEGARRDKARRKLFAQDAEAGFGFIDICRNRYDVVLMNPPFGANTKTSKSYLNEEYRSTKNDIFAMFVERLLEMLKRGGMLGVISNRTGLFLQSFEEFRKLITERPHALEGVADLGLGVLDQATVRTAAYTIRKYEYLFDESIWFTNVSEHDDRRKALRDSIVKINSLDRKDNIWIKEISDFENIPYRTFCYWAPDNIIDIFQTHESLSPKNGHIYQGIATGDNFRFLRLRWELQKQSLEKEWKIYIKGGKSKLFYSGEYLAVNWKKGGGEIKARAERKYGSSSRTVKNEETFGKKGLTYTQVTNKGLYPRVMPSGCVYDMKGPLMIPEENIYLSLGIFSSTPFFSFAKLITDSRQWHPTNLMNIPWPEISEEKADELKSIVKEMVMEVYSKHKYKEISSIFVYPKRVNEIDKKTGLKDAFRRVNRIVADGYGSDVVDFKKLSDPFREGQDGQGRLEGGVEIDTEPSEWATLSYAVGCTFGRWDIRYPLGEAGLDDLPPPTASPNRASPGMLEVTRSMNENDLPENYPIEITSDGVLVDDAGHKLDLISRVKEVFELLFSDSAQILGEVRDRLGESSLRSFFRKTGGFFRRHRKHYSKSRRKAPIYWQLAVSSKDYAVWLYYPRLTQDTLYRVLDVVKEKIRYEERQLSDLRQEAGDMPSSTERSEIADRDDFVSELRGFRKEIERVAPLWNPNMNDGVVINFAPLWRLVQHNRSWQKECKKHWDRLVEGEYDWSHWAMHLWPERVVPKCAERRDLAIAHDLEDVFWEQNAEGDWTVRDEPTRPVEELVEERTSRTVKSALEDLLNAPPPR